MRINMGDTITLDDNEEYLIVTKSFINEKEYYFLINEKSYQILFCYNGCIFRRYSKIF